MKILFLIALLTNITYFFWQFNSASLNPLADKNSVDIIEAKQILLVNELSNKNEGKNLKMPELKNKVFSPHDNPAQSNKSKKNDDKQNEVIKPENKVDSKNKSQINEDSGKKDQEKEDIKTSKQMDEAATIFSWWGDFAETEKISQSVEQTGNDITTHKVLNSFVDKQSELKSYCYQVGAFEKLDALEAWRELNNIKPALVRKVNKEKEKVTSFMVYYPAAENLAESEKNIQILGDKGINDYWLFRQGELKGVISLGKFISENRALLLQEELIKKSINVEIMERSETESSFYAQITTKNKGLKDSLEMTDKLVLSECEISRPEHAVRNSMVSL